MVFVDESGLSERPHRARTWAPRGQTPILEFNFNWSKLSIMAGVSWWEFYFRLYPRAVTGAEIVDFLGHLRRQIGSRLLVIWDGLPAHRSRRVRRWLEAQAGEVVVARLPAYAPELNPVEYLFGRLKTRELPNFCPSDYAQLNRHARAALRRTQRRPSLVRAFWSQAQLSLF